MLSELPDLDEDVSFVVDDGASTGPIPMREIVDSVRSGERSSNVLVWWAGATDWTRFDAHEGLAALAEDNVEKPVIPGPAADASPRWGLPEDHFVEPVVTQVAEPQPEPEFAAVSEAVADDEGFVSGDGDGDGDGDADADADDVSFGLPTRTTGPVEKEPRHPELTGLFSAGARVDAGLSPESDLPSPVALDAIVAARESLESVGARIEALTTATRRSLSPEEIQQFAGEAEHEYVAPVVEDSKTDESSNTETFDDPNVAEDPSTGFDDYGDVGDLPHESEPVLVASVSEQMRETAEAQPLAEDSAPIGSWRAVEDASPTDVVSYSEPASDDAHVASRLVLTERFEEMVRKSVSHQRRIEWVMRVDELLLSACITAIADSGYVAMDLTSRDSDHRVLFEHNDDSRHVRLELSPLDSVSDHLERHVRFGLSWGRDVENTEKAFETVRIEATDGDVAPGVLTCEADFSNSSVSTHVDLILAADDFVKDDYSVDRSSLDAAIAATLHALEERWQVLFA